LVFNNIEFTILYTSPLEILDFSAKNIKSGEEQTFSINVKNAGNEKNITFALEIGGETIFKEYTIESGAEKTFYIKWKPAGTGAYTAKLFLLFENNSIGPRYANFYVSERNILESMAFLPFKIFEAIFPTKMQKTYKTALEKISISEDELGITVEYSSPQIKFISKANATTLERILIKDGYKSEIVQQSGRIVQKITMNDGIYSVERNFGAFRERCKGDCEVMKNKLASAIEEINNITKMLQEKIKN